MLNFIDYVNLIAVEVPKLINNELILSYVQKYRRFKKICLIGVGSSYNAALLAKSFISQAGVICEVVYASESFYHQLIQKDVLYVVISQSGTSIICQKALKKIMKATDDFAVITGDVASPLAAISKKIIRLIMTQENVAFKSLGYAITVMELLCIFAGELIAKENASVFCKELLSLTNTIERCNDLIDEQTKGRFQKLSKVNLIGEDNCYWLLWEGALKVIEMLNVNSCCNEIEDYFHGRYLDGKDNCMFILWANSQHDELLQIKEYLRRHNPICVVDLSNFNCVFSKSKIILIFQLMILLQSIIAHCNKKMGLNNNFLSSRELVKLAKN